MARYRCTDCGHVYDEEQEGKLFVRLDKEWKCSFCGSPKGAYVKMDV